MFKRILQNRFLQSSFIVTVASFLVSIFNWGFNLIIAKSMSLADYGEYTSVLSYVILFTIPFGAFGFILIRKLGSINKDERQVYGRGMEVLLYQKILQNNLLLAVVGIGLFLLLAWKANLESISVLYILVTVIVTLLQTFYLSAFQAYELFLIYGIYLSGMSFLRLLCGAIFIRLFPHLQFLYLNLFGLALLQILIGHFIQVRTKQKLHKQLSFPNVFTYLKRPSIYIPLLATLGILGIANIDIILVKKLMMSSDAGLYGAVTLLAKVILYVTAPISSVGYIFFTGKEHKQHVNQIFWLIAGCTMIAGIGAVIFYSLFSQFVIHLFFDERFASIGSLLWLSGIYGTLYSLVTLFSHYFVAKNSRVSLAPLVCLLGQVCGIYFFHDSLRQVLMVNSGALIILVIAYGLGFVINRRDADYIA